MRLIKSINPIGGVVAALLVAMSPINTMALESSTWLDWVAAKNSGAEPNMPDFSRAGYHHGDIAIPDVTYPVYDVSAYGAVPDDSSDDSSAIQAAIDAAELNGSGVVLLHPGRYRATGLTVNSSNIVVRGAGALAGGTEIFSEGTPTTGGGTIITFRPFSTGNKSDITTVTGNVTRETFNIQVSDTSSLSVGQLVTLYSRDPNSNLLADFFAPFTPAGTETLSKGIEVKERHVIAAINSNTLTFEEPIHYDVNASYNWKIQKAGSYLTEVGLEDIALVGNFSSDNTFVHHRSTSFDDEAWKGVVLTQVRNSWIRRVRTVNTNHGIDVNNAVDTSLLEIIMEGNNGHHSMIINSSTRTLIGLVEERNIWEHPAGQTGPNSGNVFWRYDAREVMDLDNHGKYGYATLRDVMSGHNPGNGSGSASQTPRHLRYYTLWNYQFKYRGAATSQVAHNFWESAFSAIVQPIVVGYQAPIAGLLVTESEDAASKAYPKPLYPTMQINESYGTEVTPQSLYEAQLTYRKATVPNWVNDYQQDWAIFSNTTAIMDPLLDNDVFNSDSDIVLSATVPSEIATDVTKVEFLHGDTVLASDSVAPYSFTWNAPQDGTYSIQARVVRSGGESGNSQPVNIYVGNKATTPLPVTIVQALTDAGSTATELDNQPSSNLIDDDLNSYWTSNASKRKPNNTRTPQLVDFDLGGTKNVNRVDIAWTQGEQRANYLRVHISQDNINWTEVLRTISSATTSGMETYYFDGGPARYVRIIGFTNSVSRDTQISEIDLFEQEASIPFAPSQGISFDGIDDYIELADIDYGSSQRISISMWLKFSAPASTAFVMRKANSSSNNPYYIQAASNGKISARVNGINGGGIAGLADNQWHHFAMTYQGSSSYLRTYKDGVLVASVTNATPPVDNDFLVTIGGSANGSYQFAGSIDDLRIYNKKLSAAEIAELAAAPHLNETAACTPVVETNLQGFWPMADGGTTETCDVSGKANHGILNNGPSWN